MLRFLGITAGILVQVLFAVTSYYNYIFLKGSPPRAGHWALAWDAFLAAPIRRRSQSAAVAGREKEAAAIYFAGVLRTVLLYGRVFDAAAHHVASGKSATGRSGN